MHILYLFINCYTIFLFIPINIYYKSIAFDFPSSLFPLFFFSSVSVYKSIDIVNFIDTAIPSNSC